MPGEEKAERLRAPGDKNAVKTNAARLQKAKAALDLRREGYRKEDVAESMKYIDANGFDNLHLAFYKKGDIGNDQVWDVWKLEGPASVMYFRGAPHVHAWIHVKESAFEAKDPFAA